MVDEVLLEVELLQEIGPSCQHLGQPSCAQQDPPKLRLVFQSKLGCCLNLDGKENSW